MHFFRIFVLATILAVPGWALAQEGGQSALELDIIGTSRLSENNINRWSAQLIRRYTEVSAEGYRPNAMAGQVLSNSPPVSEWEVPVDFYWNFGDGTGTFTTAERVTASHIYKNDGEYTLQVEARNKNGQSVFASKQITVANKKPNLRGIKAVQVDAETASYELSAKVWEAPEDELLVRWDFGDGTQSEARAVWFENSAWKVVHQFPQARAYTVTLNVTDDRGETSEKELTLVSAGAGESIQDQMAEVDPELTAGEAQTGFEAKTSLSITSDFSGQISPIAGIYLSPIEQNSQCRFMFVAWDDARLMNVAVFSDMPGLPEAEGATFTFHSPDVRLTFFPDKKEYDFARNGLINAFTGSTLRQRLAPEVEDLSDEDRQRLTELSGLDTTAEAQTVDPNSSSATQETPFGLDRKQSFRTRDGQLELTFIPYDRAIAELDVNMLNSNERSDYQTLTLKGNYSVDLEAARNEGIMLYDQCGPARFEIEKTYPVHGSQHYHLKDNMVNLRFSEAYDVDTLNENTFQLTYPAAGSGELVPVPTQMHRSSESAFLVPFEDLWGGVRYTVRVKTGEEGVRGKNGMPLEDEDGTGWYTWDFTTKVNLVPQSGNEGNLACHVFQSVRDVPLIAGKRAVSRIYAKWQKNPRVLDSAQVREFTARVLMKTVEDGAWAEKGTDFYRFIRPDLWLEYGIKEAEAEHTAQIYWTPELSTPASILVALEVPKKPGADHSEAYWTQCATPIWDKQPELKIDYFVLGINDWTDETLRDYHIPIATDLMKSAQEYALQQFPFKKVHIRYAGTLDRSDPILGCNEGCAQSFLADNHQSSADIVIGFMPILGNRVGGSTFDEVDDSRGPGGIVLTIDDLPERRDRWVFSIVHEFGHALWLEHLPRVDGPQRDFLTVMRENAWDNGGYPVHWQRGIEGFRIDPAGNYGYNKSSVEGNAEHIDPAIYTAGPWLEELMFPITVPYSQAFISRMHYLDILEKLDAQSVAPVGRDD